MQKRNLITLAVLSASYSAYAELTTEITPAEVVVGQTAVQNEPQSEISTMQQHVEGLMEQDFAFEAQKKKLVNELELEKLRNEIRKVNQDSNISPPILNKTEADGGEATGNESAMARTAPELRALLISEIAGQRRVAVASHGGGVKIVPFNQRFHYEGYSYIARQAGESQVKIEVALE